ncbi:hypothetical protein TcG_02998 [Trypanosoma cruzi]|nr:hypothetical protein TcG_02998 [Trypanosoma cruzi]
MVTRHPCVYATAIPMNFPSDLGGRQQSWHNGMPCCPPRVCWNTTTVVENTTGKIIVNYYQADRAISSAYKTISRGTVRVRECVCVCFNVSVSELEMSVKFFIHLATISSPQQRSWEEEADRERRAQRDSQLEGLSTTDEASKESR